MKKSRVLISTATLAGACIVGAGLTGFATQDAAEINAVDAVAAIQGVAPESFSSLAAVRSDSDTAAAATLPGGSVEVAVDPADGVSLGDSVHIGLPFAQQASDAADSQLPGVVAFDNKNGSTTVPVIHSDGTVQINTVIDNADAPKRYDYPIAIPEGASLQQDANGTVAVVTADGSPLRVFGEAWAKDAHGAAVPTHYEVRGNTLTQVVDFSEATAFPVVADPSTGVYSWNCILQNGSNYWLAPGSLLGNCKGSYLKKYINGKQVQSVPLTGYGKPANPAAFGTWECLVSLAWAGFSIYGPGKFVKFASGAFGYVLAQSIPTSITSCRG
ncbi:hypothetical protein [Leifsonia sp. fls2-241-R2A-40a]|uniref:hypothetical protein n=1 Tax=Leifsonia sp. fls2-241-R2A-40a TaxID=3040290 RepID=UPI00254C6FA6|nr:hypothetical protein [Leifsonia sp. fls2-241-R2A-40a]